MKVALLWLLDENKNVMLAKRADSMSSDAGVWGPTVSGKIEDNETEIEAVLREAYEELGLSPSQITPIFLQNSNIPNHSDGKSREFSSFYAKVSSDLLSSVKLDPSEVAEVKWIPLGEVQKLVDEKSDTLIISHETKLWDSLLKDLKIKA